MVSIVHGVAKIQTRLSYFHSLTLDSLTLDTLGVKQENWTSEPDPAWPSPHCGLTALTEQKLKNLGKKNLYMLTSSSPGTDACLFRHV